MRSKYPKIGSDGLIHYELGDVKQENGVYIPVACWTTSYARRKTIQTSQAIKDYSIQKYGEDMYIYSDTDSIHTQLPIEECKKFCQIDDFKLGYWAHEGTAQRGKFVRQKCYIEEIDGKIKITCAGLPERCYDQVTWDKFQEGFTAHGKLTYKYVKGGVKLVETDFTIKEE